MAQQFSVKKRQDCHVAIAPRNDIMKTVFVIASEAKQSQADAGSPRISGPHVRNNKYYSIAFATLPGIQAVSQLRLSKNGV